VGVGARGGKMGPFFGQAPRPGSISELISKKPSKAANAVELIAAALPSPPWEPRAEKAGQHQDDFSHISQRPELKSDCAEVRKMVGINLQHSQSYKRSA
jgi:hypothetical protein